MRWYINDASLQDQYASEDAFLEVLARLLTASSQEVRLREALYTTRSFGEAPVTDGRSLREIVMRGKDADLRRQILAWVTTRGPFLEDDRLAEADDYFECLGVDVTDSGIGEAVRRCKASEPVGTYSFEGGAIDFCVHPLAVHHGLSEDRLGQYDIPNLWTIEALIRDLRRCEPAVTSWERLIEVARARFPRLWLPNSVYEDDALAAEPFEQAIAKRALRLLGHLNEYMTSRNPDGTNSARSNEIVRDLFTNAAGGDPVFTAESTSNQRDYRGEMTFPDPEQGDKMIFAHWHGKIRHRYFRMHFEWPVAGNAARLKVLYLGPKLTKS